MREFYLVVDPNRDDIYLEEASLNNRSLTPSQVEFHYRVDLFRDLGGRGHRHVLKRRCKKLLILKKI